jgi:hypothetical protein
MPASVVAPAYSVSKTGSRHVREQGKKRSGQCCAAIRGRSLAYVLLRRLKLPLTCFCVLRADFARLAGLVLGNESSGHNKPLCLLGLDWPHKETKLACTSRVRPRRWCNGSGVPDLGNGPIRDECMTGSRAGTRPCRRSARCVLHVRGLGLLSLRQCA